MGKLFANNGDPDQMPHSAASDLGLPCLPITLLGVSRLQWVNGKFVTENSMVLVQDPEMHVHTSDKLDYR